MSINAKINEIKANLKGVTQSDIDLLVQVLKETRKAQKKMVMEAKKKADAEMLAELEHEMLQELKSLRESDDFDDEPEERKRHLDWAKATEKKVGKLAKKMLSTFKKDNPKNYLEELSMREPDWVREFLYTDI